MVFRFLVFLIAILLPVEGYSASVPLILPTASPPETCEEDVWDIIKSRAEMEANREITQNQNLISKPDSVLMLTCFDRLMGHLGNYAESNFPSAPDESLNQSVSLSGIFNDIMVVLIRDTLGDSDPYLTGGRIPPPGSPLSFVKGGQLIHLLEILILDNLVDDVSAVSNAYDDILLGAGVCDKRFYIDENSFDGVLMGGRANAVSGNVQMMDSLPESVFNGCPMMNEIWNQARCNGFQMDTTGAIRESDRFHPLRRIDAANTINSYVNNEVAGNDYRTLPSMCERRTISDGDLATDLGCQLWARGIPPMTGNAAYWVTQILNLSSTGALPWTLDTAAPTYWQNLQTGAAVVAGGPGGTDAYQHRLDIFRSATAAECTAVQPVRNGLIVTTPSGNQYYDAVCPAPGCWFTPPTSLAGTGSCSQ